MDAVTGAVAIAGLKYVGAPAAEVVSTFLKKVLTPTGEAIGEVLAHPIEEWQRQRVQRAEHVMYQAATLVEESGFEPHAVPGRILMPILEHSSVEEDSGLQTKWANLLARSAVPQVGSVLPAYGSILAELSPPEVSLLDWAFANGVIDRGDGAQNIMEIPASVAANALKASVADVQLFLGNLTRLGLLSSSINISSRQIREAVERGGSKRADEVDRQPFGELSMEELEKLEPYDFRFSVTILGSAFVEACSRPGPSQPPKSAVFSSQGRSA